jgi:heat shock protein HslJ
LRADCNRGNAGYTIDVNRALSLTPAATTKMGCPPESKDTVFLRQLAEVAGYSLVDGGLVLTLKANAGSMRFTPLAR